MDEALFTENERTSRPDTHRIAEFGDLKLATGQVLPFFQMAYQTWGTLNATKTNAVLICHALSGNSNAAAWWERVVGPGKAIDTNKYFVVCANSLGGCAGSTGPSSLGPDGKKWGSRFPTIQVSDMVDAQRHLADLLGVDVWRMVCGGSMGGLQALEWSLRYPERVAKVWLTASCAAHSAMQIGFNETQRQAILRDPKWCGGDYLPSQAPVDGLAVARMIGHISYLSPESFEAKFSRRLQDKSTFAYDGSIEFQVESYLSYQGDKFGSRFDAGSLVVLTKAMDYYECSSLFGAQAEFLLTSFNSDWIYPTWQSRHLEDLAREAGLRVERHELFVPFGHDSFLLDGVHQARYVVPFVGRECRIDRPV